MGWFKKRHHCTYVLMDEFGGVGTCLQAENEQIAGFVPQMSAWEFAGEPLPARKL